MRKWMWMWIFGADCHQLLTETEFVCNSKSSTLPNEKEPRCRRSHFNSRSVRRIGVWNRFLPYESITVVSEDAVADIRIHLSEGCTRFGEVEWLSTTTIDQAVLNDQVPFKQGRVIRYPSWPISTSSLCTQPVFCGDGQSSIDR